MLKPVKPIETDESHQSQHGWRFHWRGLYTMIVVGATAVVLLLAALALITSRDAMLDGARQLEAAQQQLRTAQGKTALGPLLSSVRQHLLRARNDFDTAETRLWALSPVLPHLGWVPRVGDELAAAPDVASVGGDTSAGLLALTAGLQPVAGDLAHRTGAAARTSTLVIHLAAGHTAFGQACRLLDAAISARRSIGDVSNTTLRSALKSFDRRTPELRTLCSGLAALPGLLGAPHPRTYLLAYQNPAELRATGGFIGSAALVTVHDGNIGQAFHDTGQIPDNLTVPAPEPVQYYNVEPYWLFRDSNWSPDFPTSAALERFFLRLDLHRDVQGVIDVTPNAVAEIIAATGPIYVPEYRRWVTQYNVAQLADYYAHWSAVPGPIPVSAPGGTYKEFIRIVATRLLSRLSHLSFTQWLRLIENLGVAVAHRDVLLDFSDHSAEAFARRLGATGQVNVTRADYLFVVDSNISYNKVNPFVHEAVTYHAAVGADRWIHAELTLHYVNSAPASEALHAWGPGGGTLGEPTDYGDFVRIYVPLGAQIVTESGWYQAWSPGPAYGKTMFSGYLIVRHGHSASVRVEYVIPPNVFSATGGKTYRLVVQHQPGTQPDTITVRVSGVGVPWSSWSARQPLSDLRYSAPIQHRPFSPIPRPAPPPTIVAPNHWIEPHAYLAAPR